METINWNLALEEQSPFRYRIIMPNDDTGEVEAPTKGFVVRWPINPHFTGKNAIAIILNGTEKFKDAVFVTE